MASTKAGTKVTTKAATKAATKSAAKSKAIKGKTAKRSGAATVAAYLATRPPISFSGGFSPTRADV